MTTYNEQTETLAGSKSPRWKTPYRKRSTNVSSRNFRRRHKPRIERQRNNAPPSRKIRFRKPPSWLQFPSKELVAAMKKTDRDRHNELLDELKPFPETETAAGVTRVQNGAPAKTHVLYRGDYNQPGDEVVAEFPEVLRKVARWQEWQSEYPASAADAGAGATARRSGQRRTRSRRAPSPNWIASPEHPLTARVW